MQNGKKQKDKRLFILLIVLISAAAIIVVLAAVKKSIPNNAKKNDRDYPVSVTFVNVEQGDCSVIECGDTTVVIDGGEYLYEDRVGAFLKDEGIKTVDCYIASHPHSDHIGAAEYIINSFNVKSVMMTSFSEINVPTTVSYERMMNAVEKNGCDVIFASAGEEYTFGELTLEVFSPITETEDYNNMSIVLKIKYKNNSFLFTGDAEAEVEAQLLDSGADLSALVLKVAHHGSRTSSGDSFIAAVAPEIAVISCGVNNDYGHPHSQTLETLEKYGALIYRTDELGNITVYGDGKAVIKK